MAEIVSVLDRVYHYSGQEIAAAVEMLLRADSLIIQNEQEAFTAMLALKRGEGNFPDALIAAVNQQAGCASTLTFDKKVAHINGFTLV